MDKENDRVLGRKEITIWYVEISQIKKMRIHYIYIYKYIYMKLKHRKDVFQYVKLIE